MNKYNIQKQPTDFMLEIAEKHKSLRKSKKWSQKEMAERSGVSLGSLKRFESTGQISLSSLLQLAHVLDRLSDFEPIFTAKSKRDLSSLFSQ
jgi:transcriptional regulator with XRE-family HTH domain